MTERSFGEKAKSFLREAVDVPEKVAIAVGAGGMVLSVFAPALLGPSLLLVAGGVGSLAVTQKVWPKKPKNA